MDCDDTYCMLNINMLLSQRNMESRQVQATIYKRVFELWRSGNTYPSFYLISSFILLLLQLRLSMVLPTFVAVQCSAFLDCLSPPLCNLEQRQCSGWYRIYLFYFIYYNVICRVTLSMHFNVQHPFSKIGTCIFIQKNAVMLSRLSTHASAGFCKPILQVCTYNLSLLCL